MEPREVLEQAILETMDTSLVFAWTRLPASKQTALVERFKELEFQHEVQDQLR